MTEIRESRGIEDLLIRSEALLTGHFILSSGLHSNKYVQCAKFFQYPEFSRKAAEKLKKKMDDLEIDVVIGGAYGGIIIAYALAEAFNVRGIFAERVDGEFRLRRGFEIQPGERVLVAEDVITTGKSIKEVIKLVESLEGQVVGIAALIDRHRAETDEIPYRKEWLHSVQAEAYAEDAIPESWKEIPAVKPGSRGMK